MNTRFAGADWLKSSLNIQNISPLGETVADMMGEYARGLYHLNPDAVEKAKWSDPHRIVLTLRITDFATYDFDGLTRLVFLAHDACVRVEINGCGPGYLKLLFSQRKRVGDHAFARHPTIELALQQWRTHHPESEVAQ